MATICYGLSMYDVIVIGSGGAGLTAALAAADTGARVLVLEASSRWGGSTAVSAGEVWTPLNHRMGKLGISDSVEDALRYCLSNASGRCSEVVEAFVHAAPRMARFVEARSPIVWRAMHSPDSLAEQPGGRHAGRHLEVSPLAAGDLESMQDNFWLPTFPAILTNDEVFKLRLLLGGEWPEALAQKRTRDGHVCNGVGLIVGLMQGCRALGVQFERNTRVQRLFCGAGHEVDGVIIERDGAETVIHASNGVVLASGGFEWNETWRDSALSGQPTHPVSPPLHFGDGQRLVSDVGGVLAHMDESWSWPAQDVVDQVWPGTQTPRHDLILRERCLPHGMERSTVLRSGPSIRRQTLGIWEQTFRANPASSWAIFAVPNISTDCPKSRTQATRDTGWNRPLSRRVNDIGQRRPKLR